MQPAPSPQVVDSRWIRYRACGYLRGKGISWGTGTDPIFPPQAMDGGKYSIGVDTVRATYTHILDTDVSIIAPNSLDHVFIGAKDGAPISSLMSKLKIGGHVIIHSLQLEGWRETLADLGQWQEKDTYIRQDQFLGVWKLLGRTKTGVLPPKPRAARRACIARYGAIGDMIILSPLIRHLHEEGYEVTMNVTPYCADVLKHNPFVSNIILQERDVIPNSDLGAYWQEWIPDYDKYINLSESIEGKLLKTEGREDFYTEKSWRHATCDVNYVDQTMALAGYPELTGKRGELYFSNAEHKEARHLREKFKDRFIIMWVLKGSSNHKQYPLLEVALRPWLDAHPRAIMMLVGTDLEAMLQFSHPQVVETCGELKLRDVFCLTQYVDLVGGPESSVTNCAGCFSTPKITLLSHSTHNNLCKYWENDYCLEPQNVPCYPCHQLHMTTESCPLISMTGDNGDIVKFIGQTWQWQDSGPHCAGGGVTPERLAARLSEVYDRWAVTH